MLYLLAGAPRRADINSFCKSFQPRASLNCQSFPMLTTLAVHRFGIQILQRLTLEILCVHHVPTMWDLVESPVSRATSPRPTAPCSRNSRLLCGAGRQNSKTGFVGGGICSHRASGRPWYSQWGGASIYLAVG